MFLRYNVEKVRSDFPVLCKPISRPIIYFDSACMSLKPMQVINKLNEYYLEYPACAGRSSHSMAKKVETEVAESRNEIKKFINAKSEQEIIFTRNTTEGLNLVANSLSLKKGDEIIISDKEHNSNLIPWLKLKERGVKIIVVDSNPDNTFDIEHFKECFRKNKFTMSKEKGTEKNIYPTANKKLNNNLEKNSEKSQIIVSVAHVSNLDGVSNPLKEIEKITHENGALLVVDAAQSVPGREVDVRKLNADFLAFSGHKMLGPTGTGVLYGKKELLENMPQFIVGGDTVLDSTYNNYQPEKLPHKFEAGLQDYAGVIALSEACRYLKRVGLNNIEAHETKLNCLLTELLLDLLDGTDDMKGESLRDYNKEYNKEYNKKYNNKKYNKESKKESIKLIGPNDPKKRAGIFSFNIIGKDPHNVSGILNSSKNIMVRSGAHCVHSWFNKHNLKGSIRASFYLYNTEEEVRLFAEEIRKIVKL